MFSMMIIKIFFYIIKKIKKNVALLLFCFGFFIFKMSNWSFETEFNYAVKRGILNLCGKNLKYIPKDVFMIHEYTSNTQKWWELVVPYSLNVSQNELTSLGDDTTNWNEPWKELKIINASYNQLQSIPVNLFKLQLLGKIVFHHNKITQLPVHLGTSLGHIELQYNKLECLPDSIGECIGLNYLNVSYNNLTVLPDSLVKCRNLITLECMNNKLQGNLNIDFSGFDKMESFDASNNKLTGFDISLLNMKNIKRIGLRYNLIRNIVVPKGNIEVNRNSILSELYLGNNFIEYFPFEKFGKLGILNGIKLLDLSNNKLKGISRFIGGFSTLERFDVTNNDLNDLPNELCLIKCIKNIKWGGNPIKKFNANMSDKGTNELLNYLKSRMSTYEDTVMDMDEQKTKNMNINTKEIKLNSMKLTKLDDTVSELKNLIHLEAENNQIT